MPININTGFYSNSRENLDKRSGPYTSTTEALNSLSTNARNLTTPIYVVTGSTIENGNFIGGTGTVVKEYRFVEGIEDVNLTEIVNPNSALQPPATPGSTARYVAQVDSSGNFSWVEANASNVSYDDTSTNLTATDVQGAIEALSSSVDTLDDETNDLSIAHNASDVDISIENGLDITLDGATQSLAGAMSGADKTKLDGIEAGAEVNVGTNLSEGTTTATSVDVNSSTGTNATLAQASGTRAGVLSSAKFDEIEANTLKVSDINHNVTTNLSEGTTTTISVNVNSSDGTNATLAQASSTRAGVLSSAKFDEITANTLKVSDINHNVSTNLGITKSATTNIITSSDGTDATITAATASNAGLMTKAIFDEHVINNAKVSNVDETLTSLGLSANVLKYTDEDGVETDLDLSLYLDDSNLARLTSGSLNGSTGLATFTRDDATTFTIDMSAFLDAITLNNTLTSTSTTEGLTAAQGKVLKDLIDALPTENTQRSDEEIRDVAAAQWTNGTNTTVVVDDVANTIKINSVDTNTQLSDGDVGAFGYIKDVAWDEISGTQSDISLSNFNNDMNISGVNTGDEPDASTTVKGIIEIATQEEVNTGTDTIRAITPSRLRSTLGITATLSTTLTYSQLVGGATSQVITHSIGNQFVQVSVYEVASMDKVGCEVELTSASTITLKFNVAPAANSLRVVIVG